MDILLTTRSTFTSAYQLSKKTYGSREIEQCVSGCKDHNKESYLIKCNLQHFDGMTSNSYSFTFLLFNTIQQRRSQSRPLSSSLLTEGEKSSGEPFVLSLVFVKNNQKRL